MAPKEHALTEVVGVEQLWLCLCVSGTCFDTKLHLHFCLLRQPLITNTSTKSNFVALVGKNTNTDSNMRKKPFIYCMLHFPLSPNTDLNVYQNKAKANSVLVRLMGDY